MSLYDVPLDKPTILVLGNEGHGMRTNILRRCTHLVRIGEAPSTVRSTLSSSDTTSGSSDSGTMNSITDSSSDIDMNTSEVEVTDSSNVDSLNVSVTGAIILHHFLSTKK